MSGVFVAGWTCEMNWGRPATLYVRTRSEPDGSVEAGVEVEVEVDPAVVLEAIGALVDAAPPPPPDPQATQLDLFS